MKSKRLTWGIVSLIVLTVIAVTTGTRNGHSQQEIRSRPSQKDNVRHDDKEKNTFPVVDYLTDYELKNRDQRGEKYNDGIPVLSEDADITKDLEAALAIDPGKDLDALPATRSEIVVLGKIVETKAHLSGNKKSVYSDFKIAIETVFKNKYGQKLEDGKYLIVEREGGVIRYPSGNSFWYRIPGQQMPVTGGRYLLFLTNDFPVYGDQRNDLYLLAGYEMKDGQVIPLDKSLDRTPASFVYKGKDESTVLNDLKNILKR